MTFTQVELDTMGFPNAVECACRKSLTESLLESELFGHVKGAFTGATQDRIGKFELAKGGTLFIDEIGELSPGGQTKLLRFLQEKVIERVGGNQSVSVDARVIAATHRELSEAVKDGKFREDLYYRLNVFECHLVPLRHRQEDLPVLIERFRREFSKIAHRENMTIPAELMTFIRAYNWPGNIRELRNTVERLVYLCSGTTLSFDDLPEAIKSHDQKTTSPSKTLLTTLADIEREHILKVLAVETNQEKAAEILGITTVTLWRKRKQYGIK
jgi:transcriptional regulator with PAS, ATPase and Fis domain